jgi:erythrin-vacuolar iron transport family protein
MAGKLPPDRKIMLKFLANEELEHLKTLTAFKTTLQKNGRWIELNQKQLKRVRMPKLYVGKDSRPFIDESGTDQEILLEAMKAEKRSEEFYKRIRETVRDAKVQRLFEFLGRFERGHYELLRKML